MSTKKSKPLAKEVKVVTKTRQRSKTSHRLTLMTSLLFSKVTRREFGRIGNQKPAYEVKAE